jgi:hypothetical protein
MVDEGEPVAGSFRPTGPAPAAQSIMAGTAMDLDLLQRRLGRGEQNLALGEKRLDLQRRVIAALEKKHPPLRLWPRI